MSDLIRREDAIEAYSDIYWIDDRLNLAFREELDKIDEKIRNIPTVEIADRPQEWIPCSEKLPRPYTEVLVCDECGWVSLGSYRPCDVTEKDSGWSTLTSIKLPTDEVLAWMPLPKPRMKGADDE